MRTLNTLRCEKGAASIALILGIVAMIVTFGTAMVYLANDETKQSQGDRAENEAYFVADSGRRIAERCLQLYMVGTVKQSLQLSTNYEQVGQIADGENPVEFLELGGIANEVEDNGLDVAHYRVDLYGSPETNNLVKSTGEIWNDITPPDAEDAAQGLARSRRRFDAEITVEKLDNPIVTSDYWAFPLRFKIVVRASVPLTGTRVSRHTMTGRGTVTLYVRKAKDRSWADCLEYTEDYTSDYGTDLPMMSGRDIYRGPVHTDGQFRFAGKPGTLFEGVVTSCHENALFKDGSTWGLSDKEYYPPSAKNPKQYIVYPQFKEGYFLNVPKAETPLGNANPNFEHKVIGTSVPGATSEDTINIYAVYDEATGVMKPGGIYVVGDCDILLQTAGTAQQYTFTHYDTTGGVKGTSFVTVDYENNTTTVKRWNESARILVGLPDVDDKKTGGQNAIYVRGRVKSIRGDLALNTELAIMATGMPIEARIDRIAGGKNDWDDIVITGDIKYNALPDMTTSPPNILGLYTENGDIVVKAADARTIVHAHIMTLNGQFYCAGFNGTQRTLELFGSIASRKAGAIGSDNAGYAKDYTWDTRATFAPPPLYLTLGTQYSVTMERPDSPGHSTWRVVWASEAF